MNEPMTEPVTEPVTEQDMAAAGIRLAVADTVATVTLDRPQRRNAQTPAMWRALAAARRSLTGDVRVVVLRAEGEWFSPGLDLQAFTPEGLPGEASFADMARMPDADADALIAAYQAGFDWSRDASFISVAAVQGYALGAGFQLALAADLRVLADDARLGMLETSHGIVPDLGGSQPLVDLVGCSRALEICVTGRHVTADEAQRLGLATLVVPRDQLDAAVDDLVAALLAAPRDAVRETKALLRGAVRATYEEQKAAERAAQLRRLRDLAGPGE